MAYWDTSCLLKLYAPESDSILFKTYLSGGSTLLTAEITRLELHAALWRKESVGDLQPGGARRALAEYDADISTDQIDVRLMNSSVVQQFEAIVERCFLWRPALLLRTLDAIHLATAAVSGEREVVTTDKRLREAALNLGFIVYPPP